jgi:hypothetical protein
MGKINQNANAPMNTLKPQPGQSNSYNPKFHPLPGEWAKRQMNGMGEHSQSQERSAISAKTELQKALAAEQDQHEYWEEWQGVRPGKAVYENPRELQNTLLPSAKYGTEGRGYG